MPRLRLKTPAEIGALIRARRQALGLDQAELAEKVGVSRLWVNQVERGKPGASLGLVLRALNAVGVNLTWSEPNKRSQGETPISPLNLPSAINEVIAAAKRKARQ